MAAQQTRRSQAFLVALAWFLLLGLKMDNNLSLCLGFMLPPARPCNTVSTTRGILAPLAYKPSPEIDGTGRGGFILALSLASCVWIFSIPPEFRRAVICPAQPLPDVCVEQRSLCNDCMTRQEWVDGIQDYYKNGGGVQFDFSIDPKTIEQNKQVFQSLLGGRD